ncbi:MAG: DUF5105 domain-containing protein [Eubacteriales bacterium]|nr:DUF5105 domain-containing protein [Eubacteriales bacterium]
MILLKRNRTIRHIAFLMTIVLVMGLSSCASSLPEKAVKMLFSSLNALDFEKAEDILNSPGAYEEVRKAYTGEHDTYLSRISDVSFIEFIYGSLSVKTGKVESSGDKASITCTISAYPASKVTEEVSRALQKVKSSEAYEAAGEGERYAMLCRTVPQIYADLPGKIARTETTVTLSVYRAKDGSWKINPDRALFDAIAGGGGN